MTRTLECNVERFKETIWYIQTRKQANLLEVKLINWLGPNWRSWAEWIATFLTLSCFTLSLVFFYLTLGILKQQWAMYSWKTHYINHFVLPSHLPKALGNERLLKASMPNTKHKGRFLRNNLYEYLLKVQMFHKKPISFGFRILLKTNTDIEKKLSLSLRQHVSFDMIYTSGKNFSKLEFYLFILSFQVLGTRRLAVAHSRPAAALYSCAVILMGSYK